MVCGSSFKNKGVQTMLDYVMELLPSPLDKDVIIGLDPDTGAEVEIKPDEKEIVEDLVVTAHADARRKAEALLQEKMQALTGGLPLPPGLKLF